MSISGFAVRMYTPFRNKTICHQSSCRHRPRSCLSHWLVSTPCSYLHGIDNIKDKTSLTIHHVVGASYRYEIIPSCVWKEILHCLPAVQSLRIVFSWSWSVFLGPEAFFLVLKRALILHLQSRNTRLVNYSAVQRVLCIIVLDQHLSLAWLTTTTSPLPSLRL
jgi:hypothetical protein